MPAKEFPGCQGGWQGRRCQSWAELRSCGWQFLRLLGSPAQRCPWYTGCPRTQALGGQQDEGKESWALLTLITGQLQHQHLPEHSLTPALWGVILPGHFQPVMRNLRGTDSSVCSSNSSSRQFALRTNSRGKHGDEPSEKGLHSSSAWAGLITSNNYHT